MAPKKTPKMAPKPILKTSEQILSLLLQNQNMTVPDLMNKIGKSARTIRRTIKKLQPEGRLKTNRLKQRWLMESGKKE